MAENNIELPQSVLVEIRNLLQATIDTHSVPTLRSQTVTVRLDDYFKVDTRGVNVGEGSPSFGFGEAIANRGNLIPGQFALWVDRSAFVDPARKIALDRFLYLSLNIEVNTRTSNAATVLESVFPYSVWGGENLIGLTSRAINSRGSSSFADFTIIFRIDQRHINRLSRFLYPPGIQQHQIGSRSVVLGAGARVRSNLKVLSTCNMTRGPSAPLHSPTGTTTTFFILTDDPKAMLSRHPARTNAANPDWNVPTFVAARYYGGIVAVATTNYDKLFFKANIPGSFTYATSIDAAGETDPNAETSLTCAASLTSTIDLDCPAIMPRYTNSGQTNPGVTFSITLTSGASTCYILDYGTTPSANLAAYVNIAGATTPNYSNNRFFCRGFYTLTRGTAKTVTITRGMMILFPSTNTTDRSDFSLSYS